MQPTNRQTHDKLVTTGSKDWTILRDWNGNGDEYGDGPSLFEGVVCKDRHDMHAWPRLETKINPTAPKENDTFASVC